MFLFCCLERKYLQLHRLGAIVENPFDRKLRVGRDLSSIGSRDHDEFVVPGHEKSFFSLVLKAPPCADLQLNNTDIRFLQGLMKLFRLKRRARFVGNHNCFLGETDFDLVDARYLPQVHFGNCRAHPAGDPGGFHRRLFDLRKRESTR